MYNFGKNGNILHFFQLGVIFVYHHIYHNIYILYWCIISMFMFLNDPATFYWIFYPSAQSTNMLTSLVPRVLFSCSRPSLEILMGYVPKQWFRNWKYIYIKKTIVNEQECLLLFFVSFVKNLKQLLPLFVYKFSMNCTPPTNYYFNA
jgi:hypothetical protein